jgi:hypothetical protein
MCPASAILDSDAKLMKRPPTNSKVTCLVPCLSVKTCMTWKIKAMFKCTGAIVFKSDALLVVLTDRLDAINQD